MRPICRKYAQIRYNTFNKMEHIVEERLRALTRIQILDSKLDEIHRLRGSLPEEVSDLEDELEGLETRRTRIEADIKKQKAEIAERKGVIADNNAKIKKYQEQQESVKNNREYDSLLKEIEYLQLDVQTTERKIKQFQEQLTQKDEQLAATKVQIDAKKRELDDKKRELEVIVEETIAEEKRVLGLIDDAASHVEERYFKGYRKIRQNMRNGLAVVTIDRNACGGCFAIIPPQTHIELKQRKRIIQCENCGRILVDQEFFDGVKEAFEPHHA